MRQRICPAGQPEPVVEPDVTLPVESLESLDAGERVGGGPARVV